MLVCACTHHYMWFGLPPLCVFSSAIDTLGNKFSSVNQVFSAHGIRSVCFLLNAFLRIAPVAESFREKVYGFLERKGANILGLCLLPKSDYPGDVYFHFTSVFQDLALLFLRLSSMLFSCF